MKALVLAISVVALGCSEQPKPTVVRTAKTASTAPGMHRATIIDGPAYLKSKKIPDLHRDSPDVYVVKLAPSGPFTDQIMVMMPYGPCSTVSHIGQRFVWAGDRFPVSSTDGTLAEIAGAKYPDTSFKVAYKTAQGAIAAAAADCEATYLQDKADREAARATNSR